jgi:SNF2 family DNA or RNA helicase
MANNYDMDLSQYHPLIWDIRHGGSQRSNNGNLFVPERLESSEYTIHENMDAISFYNAIDRRYPVPIEIMSHPLYYPRFYYKDENNIITLVSTIYIHKEILEKIVLESREIPCKKFFYGLISYNYDYMSYSNITPKFYSRLKTGKKKCVNLNANVEYFCEKAMKRVDYELQNNMIMPKQITATLYEYQKATVEWMLERERDKEDHKYLIPNKLPHVYFKIGNVSIEYKEHIAFIQEEITSEGEYFKLKFRGGGLIEEVGLGKTLEMITLSYLNPAKDFNDEIVEKTIKKRGKEIKIQEKVFNLSTRRIDINGENFYQSRANLVICPNHLFGQWRSEIETMTNPKLKVVTLTSKLHLAKYTYKDLMEADFVIVTTNFLKNVSFIKTWESYIDKLTAEEKSTSINNVFRAARENLKDKDISMTGNAIFAAIHWHRLIIDEFHEIYHQPKNSWRQEQYYRTLIPQISSTYRWVVTATPFIHKKDSVMEILGFINDNTVNKGILIDKKTCDFLADNIFRRNTKTGVEQELTLPDIEEEVHLLDFSPTEMTMYNAYKSNNNNNQNGDYLRKLCCDPRLAQEDTSLLENCQTLEEIENSMINHNKGLVMKQREKVAIKKTHIEALKLTIQNLEEQKLTRKNIEKISQSITDCSERLYDNAEEALNDEKTLEDYTVRLRQLTSKLSKFKSSEDTRLERLKKANEDIKLEENTLVTRIRDLEGKERSHKFFLNVIDILRKGDMGECVICLGDIEDIDVGVTSCGHVFCFNCIKQAMNVKPRCPNCRTDLSKDDCYKMFVPSKKKKKEKPKEVEDLINNVGTKLANLILYIKDLKQCNLKEKFIIFSQWDDVLNKVSKILKEQGIKNVFCKGNCFQKNKAIERFSNTKNVRAIMLSSGNAAAGTNLTKASKIIMLDPVYGTRKFRLDTEQQAIGRAHRLGQKNNLKVVRFIMRNTVEEDIHNSNQLADNMFEKEQNDLVEARQQELLNQEERRVEREQRVILDDD